MTTTQMKAKRKAKVIQGFDPQLHSRYDHPLTKKEREALPIEERQRLETAREVDKALQTIAGFISREESLGTSPTNLKWDKVDSDPDPSKPWRRTAGSMWLASLALCIKFGENGDFVFDLRGLNDVGTLNPATGEGVTVADFTRMIFRREARKGLIIARDEKTAREWAAAVRSAQENASGSKEN